MLPQCYYLSLPAALGCFKTIIYHINIPLIPISTKIKQNLCTNFSLSFARLIQEDFIDMKSPEVESYNEHISHESRWNKHQRINYVLLTRHVCFGKVTDNNVCCNTTSCIRDSAVCRDFILRFQPVSEKIYFRIFAIKDNRTMDILLLLNRYHVDDIHFEFVQIRIFKMADRFRTGN